MDFVVEALSNAIGTVLLYAFLGAVGVAILSTLITFLVMRKRREE